MTNELTFGQWLRRRRKALDLTQSELAQQVGCAKVTLQKIEHEERRPSREIVARLMDVLEVAPDDRVVVMRAARGAQADDGLPSTKRADVPSVARSLQTVLPETAIDLASLPAPTTSLVGRDHEVAFAHALLRQPTPRLLTFTGPGGTGKTRLAVEVARVAADTFRDGVAYVALGAVTDAALVLPTIGHALGLSEQSDQRIEIVLRHYFTDKHLLLVLDNFEQVVAAATSVADLLAAAPQLKVLVTSRASLHLTGEQACPVLPLPVPDLEHLPQIKELTQYAAVDLFIQRVQAVKPSFSLTDANIRMMADICIRLDGLPLAIELVAPRIKVLSLERLLQRLQDRLTMLTGGARDLPARQRTLRATIDWSYRLLTPTQQRLFARLAVFAGGFTVEDADAVCLGEGDIPLTALDGITALFEMSMLNEMDQAGDEPRFTMLETIREYALEQLAASPEGDVVRLRHAEYYLAFVEAAQHELPQSHQQHWLNRLEAEQANLRAVLDWALERAEVEVSVRMIRALERFWVTRGHFSEGRRWVEAVLAASRTLPLLRAQALWVAGSLAYRNGDVDKARVVWAESLTVARELGHKPAVAAALEGLGLAVRSQGDPAQAMSLHEEGLALARELGDTERIMQGLQGLGLAAMEQGDLERARALHTEGLALRQALGDKEGMAWNLSNLADVARLQGDFNRAHQHYEAGLALYREVGNTAGSAGMLFGLGYVALHLGNHERAAALFQESLAQYRERGYSRGLAYALTAAGIIAEGHGEAVRAVRLWAAARRLLTAIGVPRLDVADRADYERSAAAVRTQIDDARWAAAWAEGQAMTLDEAIAHALKQVT